MRAVYLTLDRTTAPMNKQIATDLVAACSRAAAALAEAEAAIRRMPEGEEKSQHLQAVATLFAGLMGRLQVSAVRQFPELLPAEPLPAKPDTELEPGEEEEVCRLSQSELDLIDGALLSNSATEWRKVARVIGGALKSLGDRVPDLPDGFYARRVIALANSGKLESRGNLDHMRFSEVRLPSGVGSAV